MAKNERYDRQIRLWGEDGQSRLAKANILILGNGHLATETAKSLILPGIGQITICTKEKKFTGDNFFKTFEHLAALNPAVKFKVITKFEQEEVKNYSCIISTLLENPLDLVESCQRNDICLFVAVSFGTVGMIRLCLPKSGHLVLNRHTEHDKPDLRIFDQPSKTYLDFCDRIELSELDQEAFSHVPFPVLITKALQSLENYQSLNTQDLKSLLREKLKTLQRDGCEANFTEAINNINKYISKTEIPRDVIDALKASHKFSYQNIAVQALEKFILKHRKIPISGVLEDMQSTSEWYVELQTIYRNLAKADFEEYMEQVRSLLCDEDTNMISNYLEFFTQFCKNAKNIAHVQTSNFQIELSESISAEKQSKILENDWQNLLDNYFLVREKIFNLHGESLAVTKFDRVGKSELHTTSAILGGILSQEVIKIVTQQFVPLNDTLIFDGVSSKTTTYRNITA